MAFRQPAHPAPQRHHAAISQVEQAPIITQSSELQRQLVESQEWVVFSPGAPSTTQTLTASTDRTRTAGLSHLSDFGSADTAAHQSVGLVDEYSASSGGLRENAGGTEEDGADEEGDLDSLDCHLQAFPDQTSSRRANSRDPVRASILPTHDGLGSFGASSSPVQQHIFQFEQFNPRRSSRRARSLLELTEVDEAGETGEQGRTRRIHEWRLEQSRVLVEEIQRETRRRMSQASDRMTQTFSTVDEERVAMDNSARRGSHTRSESQPTKGSGEALSEVDSPENETFWQRITRRVIQDLIGIDDAVLSVIFGESLVQDSELTEVDRTSISERDRFLQGDFTSLAQTSTTWEDRLLERVARELGTLVHHFSKHPGAFSSYVRAQETPGYVGNTTTVHSSSLHIPETLPSSPSIPQNANPMEIPHFSPTLPTPHYDPLAHNSSYGIDDPSTTILPGSEYLSLEREYWERELDVSMVFSFLRNRFRRSSTVSPARNLAHPVHSPITGSVAQSTAARAAMIRQQHPLTSRASKEHPRRSAAGVHRRPGSTVGNVRRTGSCCASQSERAPGGRRRGGSGSSRNYWDLGASIGSGSVTGTSGGGIGHWGEA